MTDRFKLKITVTLGSCFGVFSALAVLVFGALFLKMGGVPKWRAPGTANAATPKKTSVRYRALATPRPDTQGVFDMPGSAWGQAIIQIDSIEFHWRPVAGAVRYRLHAWHIHDGDETTLFDADVDTGTAKVELVHRAPVQWELQALDAEGRTQMSVGPKLVE